MINDQDPNSDPFLTRRERDVAGEGVLSGPDFLYRPGQLLIATADEPLLRSRLEENGGGQNERCNELDRLGLQLWDVDESRDLLALVEAFRGAGPTAEPLRVSVNTVLSGEGVYMGGPGAVPRAAGRLPEPAQGTKGGQPALSVLDTGWAQDTPALHPALMARLLADPNDVDLLDLNGHPGLDTQAGHGTFICGLVNRLAPDLLIDIQLVLNPVGFGDDAMVAVGLAESEASVLNLSLGGYTADDRPPPALQAALHRLGRNRVVVAAAGNNGSDRPFWPAACKNVVAVAALDTTGGTPRAAKFSNRGPWVDACAPGVDLHSAYVQGVHDIAGVENFDGFACWSGTSFAAPLVAAAIARIVTEGASPRVAAAQLLDGLSSLPDLEEFGVWYDPGVDLLCAEG